MLIIGATEVYDLLVQEIQPLTTPQSSVSKVADRDKKSECNLDWGATEYSV